jgi:hypothetical protein
MLSGVDRLDGTSSLGKDDRDMKDTISSCSRRYLQYHSPPACSAVVNATGITDKWVALEFCLGQKEKASWILWILRGLDQCCWLEERTVPRTRRERSIRRAAWGICRP